MNGSTPEISKKPENLALAALIIPENIPQLSEILSKYPARNLPADAKVVRVAPSPTGFTHFGLIFTSMLNEQIANQTKGIFFLRIEDTDKKREIENGTDLIIQALHDFDIKYSEGPLLGGKEIGNYGPYIQSKRMDIYLAATRELIERGRAYPCFCSPEKLDQIRDHQEKIGAKKGYYGEYATCRHLTIDEVTEKINNKEPFTIRFRAPEQDHPSTFKDAIKGKITNPGNELDYVLVKSAGSNLGLPVYHLAAMVDDHLQGVNLVIRGDEWLSSLPVHLQIIEAFGWAQPDFGHLSPVTKMDGETTKRKLSKRKDPEAAASFYLERGIPSDAVKVYVFNIADSGFENWRKANPEKDLRDYPLSISHIGSSGGALFDMVKFADICKNEISRMDVHKVYAEVTRWAEKYNPDFYQRLIADSAYSQRILNIERTGDKRRKDISEWSQLPDLIGYFYDDIYSSLTIDLTTEHIQDKASGQEIISAYLKKYRHEDDKDTWLEKLKEICTDLGYAAAMNYYKNDPSSYKGNLGDVAMILRIALTGRTMAPDLYETMQAMGSDRVLSRLRKLST